MSEAPLLLTVPADEVFVIVRGVATITKDHAAVLPYGIDLTDWLLDGESLASCTVALDGIVARDTDTAGDPVVELSGDSSGNQKAQVWLKEGTDWAIATFSYITDLGRTDVRRLRFLIRER